MICESCVFARRTLILLEPLKLMTILGYNFKSLEHISPYLEPTTAGVTAQWAKSKAQKYGCVVLVGYPENTNESMEVSEPAKLYNSVVMVQAQGTIIGNYRKTFLYYTDETWAQEGPDGFFSGEIDGLGKIAIGICKFRSSVGIA